MYVIALFVAIWSTLTFSPLAPVQGTLDSAFTKILQAAADADARGDDRAYERRTTPHYFSVDEKGSVTTLRDALSNPPSVEARQRRKGESEEEQLSVHVDDVHATMYGNTAIVRSRLVGTLVLNGERVSKQFRVTHVFVRERNGWLLAARQETVIPLDPIPVQNNHNLYGDYAGHYRLLSSITLTVTRDGDRLLWGNTLKHELVPESDTTFVIKGNQYRVIFMRDANGVVTHLRLREFPGVEYSAIRLPGP